MTNPFLLLLALLPPGGHASLHPPGALAFVEVPDVQGVLAAHGQTALGRLLADEGVHAALGELMGQRDFDPRAQIARLLALPAVDAPDAPTWDELLRGLTAVSYSLHEKEGGFVSSMRQADALKRMELDMRRLARLVALERDRAGGLPESLAEIAGVDPELLVDPWGSPYVLVETEEAPGFTLRSLGLDGEPGGEGLGADLELGQSTEATEALVTAETFGGELVVELGDEALAARAFAMAAVVAEGAGAALERGHLALPGGGECESIRFSSDFSGPVEVVHRGKRLIAIIGTLDRHALAARLTAAGEGDSDATNAELATAFARFTPHSGVTVVRGYSRHAPELLELSGLPTLAPLFDVLEGLIGPAFAAAARGGTWRMDLREGVFVSEGLTSPLLADPLEGVLGSTKLADSAYGLLSPDALTGWLTSVDVPRFIAALMGFDEAGTGERALAALDEKHGFRPDRDLIEPLGGELALNLPPLRSLMSAPDVSLALSLRDSEAFLRGMEGAARYITAELGDSVKTEASDYRGARLYTFTASGLPIAIGGLPLDPSALVRPTVAVLSDRVLLTTLPSHAKRAIRRLRSDDPPEPATFDRARFPAGASVVAFADWATFFGKVYSSARVMAPMLAGGAELPIDLAALPEESVFTRFFAPSVRWNRTVEGGVLHHAESSFGPDVPLLALAGLAAFRAAAGHSYEAPAGTEGGAGIRQEAPESVRAGRAREETLQVLARVKVALQVYSFDQDAFPADLAALEASTPAFPNGFLDGGAVPNDAWGRALRYVRNAEGYDLWSVGPDGKDDEGGGDDVRAN